VTRWFFAIIFVAAGLFNTYTALTNPQVYMMYGEVAVLPFYRNFIYSIFSQYTAVFIIAIATGQLASGMLLAVGKRIPLGLGTLGGIVFLTAIAPLGFGSAFPFSVFTVAALIVMYRKLTRQE
jgi:hypothetical protein